MAPLIPRFHLFEIDDQPWFPSFLRSWVQDALTETWTAKVPLLQSSSPARLAATLLTKHLGSSLPSHTFIDFCAGGGGPTPRIERHVNRHLTLQKLPNVDFILTDLHPNPESWAKAAVKSPHVGFEPESVDAANAPPGLLARHVKKDKKAFRLFNLAFHHFDDPLAKEILKNTLETSDGFAIFELQDRTFASFVTCMIFGVCALVAAPYYSWRWRNPLALVFTYLIPILPFVIVYDGLISSLRTRTPEEVEVLLRSCGADSDGWEMRSGRDMHLWPSGYMNWIICVKK